MSRRAPAATVVLAVSGHGFGHAVRCAVVAGALLRRGARVLLRSEAPVWLFPAGVEAVAAPGDWPLDVGVAQHDGLDFDIDETRRRWDQFAATFDAHAAAEAQLLRELQADVLLGDIPPLAFAAAARAGIPGLAMGNFGWDWIYAPWPGFETAIACIRRGYRQASRLLRLPLRSSTPDAFEAFSVIEDVPLVARTARRPRAAVRAELGLPDTRRVVLLSFGGFPSHDLDLHGLAKATNYTFLVTPPLSWGVLEPGPHMLRFAEQPHDYVSLLAACDAVVTKPGYGIVADCLANRVPILYTDRGPFREYDVLVEAIHRLGHGRYVPRADVLAGALAPHLDALLGSPAAWQPLRLDGAEVVAERVLDCLELLKTR